MLVFYLKLLCYTSWKPALFVCQSASRLPSELDSPMPWSQNLTVNATGPHQFQFVSNQSSDNRLMYACTAMQANFCSKGGNVTLEWITASNLSQHVTMTGFVVRLSSSSECSLCVNADLTIGCPLWPHAWTDRWCLFQFASSVWARIQHFVTP